MGIAKAFIKLEFLRVALDEVFFQKLLSEGYLYVRGPLSNFTKKQLTSNLRKQGSCYKELFHKEGGIKKTDTMETKKKKFCDFYERHKNDEFGVYSNKHFTYEAKLAVIYALFFGVKVDDQPEIIYEYFLLMHENCEPPFNLSGDSQFILRDDMYLKKITSVGSFVSYIKELAETGNMFFRGHSYANYLTLPSLFREQKYLKNESSLYQELIVRCPDKFTDCKAHLDFLVTMQHYGLPTRLLDLTTNAAIALYFACESGIFPGEILCYSVPNSNLKYTRSDTVSILTSLPLFNFEEQQQIFELSKEPLKSFNDIEENSVVKRLLREIQLEKPTFTPDIDPNTIRSVAFVKSTRLNDRIKNQEGAFAVFGLMDCGGINLADGDNLLQQYRCKGKASIRESGKTIILIVGKKEKGEIKKELDYLGINKAFVYPEIDDVSEYLKEQVL